MVKVWSTVVDCIICINIIKKVHLSRLLEVIEVYLQCNVV